MSQHQSRLLSLPRELRDQIYRYAVIERDGYHHDPTSGRLRTVRATSPQLALEKTCRQIAEEMNGLALKENIIIFKSYSDSNVSSLAENFNRLRNRRNSALGQMLGWASECITLERLIHLRDRYPFHGPIRRLCERDTSSRIQVLEASGIPQPARMPEHLTYHAVQELVEMISTDERFLSLTSKDYDKELRGAQRLFDWVDWGNHSHMRSYNPGSQMRLIELKLQPWDIPEPHILEELDSFLPELVWESESESDSDSEFLEPADPIITHDRIRFVSYFSGTAYAIKFFGNINPDNFGQLKRIIIEENHDCVGNMESHAHGLIAFCQKNQNLKLDIRVNIWHTIIKFGWSLYNWDSLRFSSIISKLGNWLREISRLQGQGMPEGQCTFIFCGAEPSILQRIWIDVKKVAAVHEAIQQLPEPEPEDIKHPLLHEGIPEDFHFLVKQAIKGDLPVSFGPDMGGIWNLEQACYDLEHTFSHTSRWQSIVDFTYLEQEIEIWAEVKKQY